MKLCIPCTPDAPREEYNSDDGLLSIFRRCHIPIFPALLAEDELTSGAFESKIPESRMRPNFFRIEPHAFNPVTVGFHRLADFEGRTLGWADLGQVQLCPSYRADLGGAQ